MVSVSVKKNVGDSGLAKVGIGKNSIRVAFQESGVNYELPLEEWKDNRPAGEYNVTLTSRNDKILAVKPIEGTYLFKFDSMGNVVNGVPEPAIQRGGPRSSRDGKKKWVAPDQIVWRANLEVVSEGRFEGLTVMYSLPYAFTSDPVSGNTQIVTRGKRDLETLDAFFRVVGFDLAGREIPFSQNVLPWLETEFKKLGTTFMGKVNEAGFVNDLSVVPAELLPKKTTKKAKAK